MKTFETSKRLVHVFGFDLLVVDLPNSKTIPAKESSLDLSPIQPETYFGTIHQQTKSAAGPNSTRTATRPYQGLSIDFSFSGTKSKNEERAQDYEGINGETSWILISDHFTRHLTGDTRLSKASPIHWLRQFLDVNTPNCPGKYVYLDQGGELYHNPAVRKLFAQKGYAIRPTGADASHQNGPVERSHRTVANQIRCLLSGANISNKILAIRIPSLTTHTQCYSLSNPIQITNRTCHR